MVFFKTDGTPIFGHSTHQGVHIVHLPWLNGVIWRSFFWQMGKTRFRRTNFFLSAENRFFLNISKSFCPIGPIFASKHLDSGSKMQKVRKQTFFVAICPLRRGEVMKNWIFLDFFVFKQCNVFFNGVKLVKMAF